MRTHKKIPLIIVAAKSGSTVPDRHMVSACRSDIGVDGGRGREGPPLVWSNFQSAICGIKLYFLTFANSETNGRVKPQPRGEPVQKTPVIAVSWHDAGLVESTQLRTNLTLRVAAFGHRTRRCQKIWLIEFWGLSAQKPLFLAAFSCTIIGRVERRYMPY